MTTAIATEVNRRRRPKKKGPRVTFAGDLAGLVLATIAAATQLRWPSPRYRDDPVAFAHNILGVEPWGRQVQILEAARDHMSVAITSGHKTGKSASAAMIALWYYCSFPDARVVMSSTTSRQVDRILWRELRMMKARGGRCLACKAKDPSGRRIPRPCEHSALIDGEPGELARTGLKSIDFREVVGFTAREAEAVAGVSGANLLYLIDEASGVPDIIFEAIEGNRMGGARLIMFSNPTRNEGTFYDAFHKNREYYETIQISSEETPNFLAGERLIPGLATRDVIERKRLEWGEDSPLYKVRIKGEFAVAEDGKIFSIHRIGEAEDRWEETSESGRLYIGVDPSGESGTGDEAVFSSRRGLKQLSMLAKRGLTEAGHLAVLLGMIAELAVPRETPVVVIDKEGEVGAKVHAHLAAYADQHPNAFELVGVRASQRAIRKAQVFDRVRDELAANLDAWFRDGGAILEDTKLAAELHAFEWRQAINGRLKLWPAKADLRKKESLGRSPDRFDALALSCWEPLALQDGVPETAAAVARRESDDDFAEVHMDPYAGSDAWSRR